MGRARALAKDEKYEQAVSEMGAVIAEDPGIIDAHITLGGWLGRLKRPADAIASYKRALEIQPDSEQALSALADAYRAHGRPEAAVEGYRTVLRLEPRSPHIWYQLATLYLDLGRESESEETFRRALEHNPKMGAAYNSLAALAFERGDMAGAERLVRQGLELEKDLRSSRFNLARILEARGDQAGAERLYRDELSLYADNGRARFNLAQLLRQRGGPRLLSPGAAHHGREGARVRPLLLLPRPRGARGGAARRGRRPRPARSRDRHALVRGPPRPLRPRRRLQPPGTPRGRQRRGGEGTEDRVPAAATARRADLTPMRKRTRALLLLAALVVAAGAWAWLRRPAPLPAGLEGAIVFVSDRDGPPALYWRRLPRDRERRLTFGSEAVGEPAVSPDGTRVAFSMNGRIGVVAVASGETRLLTLGVDWRDAQPSWLPDGRRLVVSSRRRPGDPAGLHLLEPGVPPDGDGAPGTR